MKKNLIISLFILFSLVSSLQTKANTIEEIPLELNNDTVISSQQNEEKQTKWENLKQQEDATTFYNEAIDVFRQDDIDKSIELFQKAIEINPDFYEAHYNLAQILMSLDKNDEALKSLQRIDKIRPNDPETLYNIGKIQYKQGFLSNSYNYLKKIESQAPQYESAKLLLNKIEKRQEELNLQEKIKQNKVEVDSNGIIKGTHLETVEAASGIALDSMGNIYIASFKENKIYKISLAGEKSILTDSELIKSPIGLAIDKTDNIYVANYGANNIIKISPSGTTSVFAYIQKPYFLIYDEAHSRLYATEYDTHKLIKFDI